MRKTESKNKKETKSTRTVDLYDQEGKVEKTIELPDEIFNVKVSKALLAQYVHVYLTNQRMGTASTKTRGDVSGSTRKIYRQKGTGKARHGDIKAPVFVGGGIVGGPKPHDYSLKINKKQKRKALLGSLTLKHKEREIIGLSKNVSVIKPKTKHFVHLLQLLNIDSKSKVLLVIPKMEKNNLLLSARNIPYLQLTDASSLNPYMVLNSQKILITENALEVLKDRFLGKNEN